MPHGLLRRPTYGERRRYLPANDANTREWGRNYAPRMQDRPTDVEGEMEKN